MPQVEKPRSIRICIDKHLADHQTQKKSEFKEK